MEKDKGRKRKGGRLRRSMVCLLAAALIFNTLPASGLVVSASEQEKGLCEHHRSHTADCGYMKARPCTHEHGEECYKTVTECVHEHTDECYPEVEETEESTGEGNAAPSDEENREPRNCTHRCSEESGCITRVLDCRHEHDENCGYAEAQKCGYVCKICNGTEPEDTGENAENTEDAGTDTAECICKALCTEDSINKDCPVCGADDAGFLDCKGKVSEENTENQEDTGICKHHQEHDADCGYIPKSEDGEGSPCTYECRICPVEDLIAALPDTVTEDNAEEVRVQLDEILDLYRELNEDEQGQIDLSHVTALQGALDGANTPMTAEGRTEQQDTDKASVAIGGETFYYATLEEAFAAANGQTAAITMLADAECIHSGSNGSPLNINSGTVTLNLNGNALSGKGYGYYGIIDVSGGSLLVQGEDGEIKVARRGLSCRGNGKLIVEGITLNFVGDNTFFAAAGIYNEGGTVTLNGTQMTGAASDGQIYHYSGTTTVNNVTATGTTENCPESVYYQGNSGTLTINGGTFDKITVYSGNYGGVQSVAELLGEGYTYKKQGGTWATADDLAGLEISNVTVAKIPLTIHPQGDTSWFYSTQQTHTLAMNAAPVSGGTVTYVWKNGNETLGCTSDACTVPAGMTVGSYTYTCEATCDGYTLSHTFTFKIEQSGTEFTGGIKTYNGSEETTSFSADDTITVKAAPTPTGKAPVRAATRLRSEPASGQMGVYVENTPVSDAADAGADGSYTMTVSASDVLTYGQTDQDGKFTLTVKFIGNAGMADAEGTAKVTVISNPLTADMVTLSGESAVYNGAAQKPALTVDGLTAGTDYDVSYTRDGVVTTDFTTAGTVRITVTGKGIYEGTVKKTFTIEKAEQENFALAEVTKQYEKNGTFTLSVTGGRGDGAVLYRVPENNGVLMISGDRATVIGAGTVTVTAVKAESDNYRAATATAVITIAKAPAPAINYPAAGSITYGQRLSDSILSGGSTEYGAFAWENAGTVPAAGNTGYTVNFTASEETKKNYEEITDTTGKVAVSVEKAVPAVSITAAVSGGEGSREAVITVTVPGAGAGVSPTGTVRLMDCTGGTETEIGTAALSGGAAAYTRKGLQDKEYTVKAVYGGDGNYKGAESRELTFDAAKQDQRNFALIHIGAKTYGDSITLATTGGGGSGAVKYVSSDEKVIRIEGGRAVITGAGSATVTAVKEGDNNYNEASASEYVTVAKKPLTVTADNRTVVKGAPMPEFTYRASGLVNGDTFTAAPSMTTEVSDTDALGKYDIVISGGTLRNCASYRITYVNGTLNIVERLSTATAAGGSGGSGNHNSHNNGEKGNKPGSGAVTSTDASAGPGNETAPGTEATPINPGSGTEATPVNPGSGTEEAPVNPGNGTTAGPGTAQGGGAAAEGTKQPFIKGGNGRTGWDMIRAGEEKAEERSIIDVDMNGSTVVPGDIFDRIRDRDITVTFDMGDGIVWSVNGKSITADKAVDIDFSVKTGTDAVPADIVNDALGERYSIQISLSCEGEFGFTAVLSLNLGSENAGYTASLYYYNEATGELAFICADEVAEDGAVSLVFTHASDYVIAIDGDEEEESGTGETARPQVPDETDENEGNEGNVSGSLQTGRTWMPVWLIAAGVLAAAMGIAVFFAVRKKKEND